VVALVVALDQCEVLGLADSPLQDELVFLREELEEEMEHD